MMSEVALLHQSAALVGQGRRWRSLVAPAAAAAAAGGVCVTVFFANPTAPGNPLPICPIKAVFGVDCPGCGALRMSYMLLHGDLPAAAHYNALALAAVPLLVWAWATWVVGRWRGKRVRSWQDWRWAPHVTMVITLVWFVIRNLPSFHSSLYV